MYSSPVVKVLWWHMLFVLLFFIPQRRPTESADLYVWGFHHVIGCAFPPLLSQPTDSAHREWRFMCFRISTSHQMCFSPFYLSIPQRVLTESGDLYVKGFRHVMECAVFPVLFHPTESAHREWRFMFEDFVMSSDVHFFPFLFPSHRVPTKSQLFKTERSIDLNLPCLKYHVTQ